MFWFQLIQVDERLSKTFDTNETHMSSTLTLANVTAMDTGYFRFIYGDVEVKQYVYVFGSLLIFLIYLKMGHVFLNHTNIFTLLNCIDGKNLVIISDKSYFPNYYLFFFHQGELGVHIPCKPTHPNVTVSLIHWERLNEMEHNTEVIIKK